jgi:hypothetical protein
MTIYDQDYMAEANLQHQYTGVVDSAAVSPEVIAQEQVALKEEVASASNESEKEYNFKALRESIAQEKAERESERLRYSQELEYMRGQIAAQQQPAQKQNPLEDDRDDDLLTVGKYRQAQAEYEQMLRQQEDNYRLRVNELETKVQNPDYDEVMDKYAIPLLKTNRDFAMAFQNSENKASFAYNLGRMHRDSQQREQTPPQQPEVSQKAQRIVENSSKPGTLSSARGGQPSLSKAEYYASMSETEFNALVEKNLTEV